MLVRTSSLNILSSAKCRMWRRKVCSVSKVHFAFFKRTIIYHHSVHTPSSRYLQKLNFFRYPAQKEELRSKPRNHFLVLYHPPTSFSFHYSFHLFIVHFPQYLILYYNIYKLWMYEWGVDAKVHTHWIWKKFLVIFCVCWKRGLKKKKNENIL